MWGNLAQSQQDEGPVLYKDDFSTVSQPWLFQDNENGYSLVARGILEITDYPT